MTRGEFDAIMARHRRVAIAGPPRTGKTTLAAMVRDRPVIATDDTKDHPWEDQPGLAIKRTDGMLQFVIEGIQVGRALRKGLSVDAVIILDQPHEELSKGQEAMAKGCRKILSEALAMRNDLIVYREGK